MITAYRVFRISREGRPQTLFHGWWGSRTLLLDVDLEAQVRPVTNPGKKGKGRVFQSGWHVVTETEALWKYLRRFKRTDDLVVCRVRVDGVRQKPGSGVLLADTMVIHSYDWSKACS
jgi:hypothetical protein